MFLGELVTARNGWPLRREESQKRAFELILRTGAKWRATADGDGQYCFAVAQ